MRLTALAVITSLALGSGCTLLGAVTGAGVGTIVNHVGSSPHERIPVGVMVLFGGLIGFFVDVVILTSIGNLFNDLEKWGD